VETREGHNASEQTFDSGVYETMFFAIAAANNR
jgi:hypothetical protein